jgi:hypothetical protein
MYDFHKAPIVVSASVGGAYSIKLPVVVSAQCKSCRGACEQGSTICDGCLDVLEGVAEVRVEAAPRRCCDGVECHCRSINSNLCLSDSDGDEPDTGDVPVAVPSSPEQDASFDLAADVHTAVDLCATCVSPTTCRCPCGRLVCGDCVDETGRCPQCGEG